MTPRITLTCGGVAAVMLSRNQREPPSSGNERQSSYSHYPQNDQNAHQSRSDYGWGHGGGNSVPQTNPPYSNYHQQRQHGGGYGNSDRRGGSYTQHARVGYYEDRVGDSKSDVFSGGNGGIRGSRNDGRYAGGGSGGRYDDRYRGDSRGGSGGYNSRRDSKQDVPRRDNWERSGSDESHRSKNSRKDGAGGGNNDGRSTPVATELSRSSNAQTNTQPVLISVQSAQVTSQAQIYSDYQSTQPQYVLSQTNAAQWQTGVVPVLAPTQQPQPQPPQQIPMQAYTQSQQTQRQYTPVPPAIPIPTVATPTLSNQQPSRTIPQPDAQPRTQPQPPPSSEIRSQSQPRSEIQPRPSQPQTGLQPQPQLQSQSQSAPPVNASMEQIQSTQPHLQPPPPPLPASSAAGNQCLGDAGKECVQEVAKHPISAQPKLGMFCRKIGEGRYLYNFSIMTVYLYLLNPETRDYTQRLLSLLGARQVAHPIKTTSCIVTAKEHYDHPVVQAMAAANLRIVTVDWLEDCQRLGTMPPFPPRPDISRYVSQVSGLVDKYEWLRFRFPALHQQQNDQPMQPQDAAADEPMAMLRRENDHLKKEIQDSFRHKKLLDEALKTNESLRKTLDEVKSHREFIDQAKIMLEKEKQHHLKRMYQASLLVDSLKSKVAKLEDKLNDATQKVNLLAQQKGFDRAQLHKLRLTTDTKEEEIERLEDENKRLRSELQRLAAGLGTDKVTSEALPTPKQTASTGRKRGRPRKNPLAPEPDPPVRARAPIKRRGKKSSQSNHTADDDDDQSRETGCMSDAEITLLALDLEDDLDRSRLRLSIDESDREDSDRGEGDYETAENQTRVQRGRRRERSRSRARSQERSQSRPCSQERPQSIARSQERSGLRAQSQERSRSRARSQPRGRSEARERSQSRPRPVSRGLTRAQDDDMEMTDVTKTRSNGNEEQAKPPTRPRYRRSMSRIPDSSDSDSEEERERERERVERERMEREREKERKREREEKKRLEMMEAEKDREREEEQRKESRKNEREKERERERRKERDSVRGGRDERIPEGERMRDRDESNWKDDASRDSRRERQKSVDVGEGGGRGEREKRKWSEHMEREGSSQEEERYVKHRTEKNTSRDRDEEKRKERKDKGGDGRNRRGEGGERRDNAWGEERGGERETVGGERGLEVGGRVWKEEPERGGASAFSGGVVATRQPVSADFMDWEDELRLPDLLVRTLKIRGTPMVLAGRGGAGGMPDNWGKKRKAALPMGVASSREEERVAILKKDLRRKMFMCPVCEKTLREPYFSTACQGHRFCLRCFFEFKEKIEDREIKGNLRCPVPGCTLERFKKLANPFEVDILPDILFKQLLSKFFSEENEQAKRQKKELYRRRGRAFTPVADTEEEEEFADWEAFELDSSTLYDVLLFPYPASGQSKIPLDYPFCRTIPACAYSTLATMVAMQKRREDEGITKVELYHADLQSVAQPTYTLQVQAGGRRDGVADPSRRKSHADPYLVLYYACY